MDFETKESIFRIVVLIRFENEVLKLEDDLVRGVFVKIYFS